MSEEVVYEVGEDYPDTPPEVETVSEPIDADNIIIVGDKAVFRLGYNVVTEIPLVELGEVQNIGD